MSLHILHVSFNKLFPSEDFTPRPTDQHQSVGPLVPGHTERMHNLDYFCIIYYVILNDVFFFLILPDYLRHICL